MRRMIFFFGFALAEVILCATMCYHSFLAANAAGQYLVLVASLLINFVQQSW